MVALLTPARAATASIVRPPSPTSPARCNVASRMARSARASRGRPGPRWTTSLWSSVGDGRDKAGVLTEIGGRQQLGLLGPGPRRQEEVGHDGSGGDDGGAETQTGVQGVDEGHLGRLR